MSDAKLSISFIREAELYDDSTLIIKLEQFAMVKTLDRTEPHLFDVSALAAD